MLFRIIPALPLGPTPPPPELLGVLGDAVIRVYHGQRFTPLQGSRCLDILTGLGWGFGLDSSIKQQLLSDVMDTIYEAIGRGESQEGQERGEELWHGRQDGDGVTETRERSRYSSRTGRGGGGGSGGRGSATEAGDTLYWDCPLVVVPLVTALSRGGFVGRDSKEWWLLLRLLLLRQWHRYSPGRAVLLLQALAKGGYRPRGDLLAQRILPRVAEGFWVWLEGGSGSSTSIYKGRAGSNREQNRSVGARESSSRGGGGDDEAFSGVPSLSSPLWSSLSPKELAAVLPALAAMRSITYISHWPAYWWPAYQVATTAAAASGQLPVAAVANLMYAAAVLQLQPSQEWVRALLGEVLVGGRVGGLAGAAGRDLLGPGGCLHVAYALSVLDPVLLWGPAHGGSTEVQGVVGGRGLLRSSSSVEVSRNSSSGGSSNRNSSNRGNSSMVGVGEERDGFKGLQLQQGLAAGQGAVPSGLLQSLCDALRKHLKAGVVRVDQLGYLAGCMGRVAQGLTEQQQQQGLGEGRQEESRRKEQSKQQQRDHLQQQQQGLGEGRCGKGGKKEKSKQQQQQRDQQQQGESLIVQKWHQQQSPGSTTNSSSSREEDKMDGPKAATAGAAAVGGVSSGDLPGVDVFGPLAWRLVSVSYPHLSKLSPTELTRLLRGIRLMGKKPWGSWVTR